MDQLVGTTEIAQRLGVKRPRVVHDWRRRHHEFPQSVVTLTKAMLWYWPEVERWAKRTDACAEIADLEAPSPR